MTNASPEQSKKVLECAAGQAPGAVKILPSTFRAAVTDVEEHHQEYRRAAYLIHNRQVTLAVATAHGSRKAQITPCPDPRSVDPWKVDPATLPDESATVTVCPTCAGHKKVTCPTCAGAAKLACLNCGGRGQVPGQRGPKNCPKCRGKGTRRCPPCNGRGQVQCDPCEGLGRVQAWLQVQAQSRTQINIHPQAGLAEIHTELEAPRDLDRDPNLFPVPLMSDTGWGTQLPPGLGPELVASFDPLTDRIESRRLQVFGSSVYHCRYRTLTGSGRILVSGRPLQVVPGSDWAPWRRRWIVSLVTGAVMLLLLLIFYRSFAGRAEWFAAHPSTETIRSLGFLGALLSVVAVAGLCLPKGWRSWVRFRLPALGVAGAWMGMLLAWSAATPSLEEASAYLAQGEIASAKQVIEAVEAVEGPSDEVLAATHDVEAVEAERERLRRQGIDELHFERVKGAQTTPIAEREVARHWEFDEAREEAVAYLLARADTDMETLFTSQNHRALAELAKAIESYDPSVATRARSRQALARANMCLANEEYECVVTSLGKVALAEGDTKAINAQAKTTQAARQKLEARLRTSAYTEDAKPSVQKKQIQARLKEGELFATLTGEPSPVDKSALDRKLVSIERELEKQAKRAEAQRKKEEAQQAKAARKAARAARREEERQAKAAARRARQADRVRCCDGRLSPSCRYSQGSLRGCCSHHGGVC